MRVALNWTGVALAAFVVAACDNGGSAVETRDRSAGSAAAAPQAAADMTAGGEAVTAEVAPVMTANRRETTDAKVARLFERNGAAFGARTASDYLEKVRSFADSPPRGTERVVRANGDVLLYQASTNTFAVVSRDGVPKTMFKPDDGPTYWAQQKDRAPTFGQGRSASASQ